MLLRRPDNNYLFYPWKCSLELLLQPPYQGHPGDVSPPAESGGHDPDRVPVFNARKPDIAAFGKVALPRRLDDRLDLFFIPFFCHGLSPNTN